MSIFMLLFEKLEVYEMICANDYCLYNKEFECSLEGINLNSVGMCDDWSFVKCQRQSKNADFRGTNFVVFRR